MLFVPGAVWSGEREWSHEDAVGITSPQGDSGASQREGERAPKGRARHQPNFRSWREAHFLKSKPQFLVPLQGTNHRGIAFVQMS
jgi:hypothetical protein